MKRIAFFSLLCGLFFAPSVSAQVVQTGVSYTQGFSQISGAAAAASSNNGLSVETQQVVDAVAGSASNEDGSSTVYRGSKETTTRVDHYGGVRQEEGQLNGRSAFGGTSFSFSVDHFNK